MKNNLTVTKSNWLVEASYKLNLEEQRLILFCIAKIDSRYDVQEEISLTAVEYAEMFKIDKTNAYRQIVAATTSLYDRDIKLHDEINKKRSRMRWISSVDYHYGEGKVTLCFSRRVSAYLGKLKHRFTSYKLQQVSDLKSSYSIRLFELLQQFNKTGERSIEVKWLREYLDLGNKYSKFSDLRKWLIEPSIEELNTKTNLIINYTTIKHGCRVNAIKFTFLENSPKVKKKSSPKKLITPEEYAAIHPKKTLGKTTKEVIYMMQNDDLNIK